jgi:hypothetical protein
MPSLPPLERLCEGLSIFTSSPMTASSRFRIRVIERDLTSPLNWYRTASWKSTMRHKDITSSFPRRDGFGGEFMLKIDQWNSFQNMNQSISLLKPQKEAILMRYIGLTLTDRVRGEISWLVFTRFSLHIFS